MTAAGNRITAKRVPPPALSAWWWVVAAALAAALVTAWLVLPLGDWLDDLRSWVSDAGPAGALIYGLIYIVAVVFFAPGSALSITAGVLYGVWGIPLVIVAATCGASLSFLISRYVLRNKVRAVLATRISLQAVENAVSEEGWKIALLLRLSPLVPFNLQNYAFGITRIPFLHFVAATLVGIIPGVVAWSILALWETRPVTRTGARWNGDYSAPGWWRRSWSRSLSRAKPGKTCGQWAFWQKSVRVAADSGNRSALASAPLSLPRARIAKISQPKHFVSAAR
jgi:uncharacterized membrane protein YdjX (TVP38/TMEM64 family)